MNNKLFISGCITSDPHYAQKFESAEIVARKPYFFDRHGREVYKRTHRFGYSVVNPTELYLLDVPLREFPWAICMLVCLWHLAGCSTVYFLRDWKQSRRAQIEHRCAKILRKKIIYQVQL